MSLSSDKFSLILLVISVRPTQAGFDWKLLLSDIYSLDCEFGGSK